MSTCGPGVKTSRFTATEKVAIMMSCRLKTYGQNKDISLYSEHGFQSIIFAYQRQFTLSQNNAYNRIHPIEKRKGRSAPPGACLCGEDSFQELEE